MYSSLCYLYFHKRITEKEDYYIKGKICSVKYSFSAQYGTATFNISDDGKTGGTEFTAYSVYYYGMNPWVDGNTQVAVNDDVILYGKITNYGGTLETASKQACIYSLNGKTSDSGSGGGGGDTPSGDVGSATNPYTVSAAIAKAEQSNVYVKAYIVGWVEGQVYADGAHFNADATVKTNILIAESASETDPAKCMPVQLPSGAVRDGVNLQENSGNYKKEVLLYGNITKYFGTPGLKNTSYAKIGSTEIGTKP